MNLFSTGSIIIMKYILKNTEVYLPEEFHVDKRVKKSFTYGSVKRETPRPAILNIYQYSSEITQILFSFI